MISAIVIIAKQQPQHTYIVKAEDWLNPKIYVIDGQDPYTGDTAVIVKAQYKLGWVIDENGEANFSFWKAKEWNFISLMTTVWRRKRICLKWSIGYPHVWDRHETGGKRKTIFYPLRAEPHEATSCSISVWFWHFDTTLFFSPNDSKNAPAPLNTRPKNPKIKSRAASPKVSGGGTFAPSSRFAGTMTLMIGIARNSASSPALHSAASSPPASTPPVRIASCTQPHCPCSHHRLAAWSALASPISIAPYSYAGILAQPYPPAWYLPYKILSVAFHSLRRLKDDGIMRLWHYLTSQSGFFSLIVYANYYNRIETKGLYSRQPIKSHFIGILHPDFFYRYFIGGMRHEWSGFDDNKGIVWLAVRLGIMVGAACNTADFVYSVLVALPPHLRNQYWWKSTAGRMSGSGVGLREPPWLYSAWVYP